MSLNNEISNNVIDIFRDRIYCDLETEKFSEILPCDVTHNEINQAIQAAYISGKVRSKIVDIFINKNSLDNQMNSFSNPLPCDTTVVEVLEIMQSAFDAGQSVH